MAKILLSETLRQRARQRGGLVLRRELLADGVYSTRIPALIRAEELTVICPGVYVVPENAPYGEDRYRALIAGYLLKRRVPESRLPLAGASSLIFDGLPLWRPDRRVYVTRGHGSGSDRGSALANVGPVPARLLIETPIPHDPLGRMLLRTRTARSLLDAARLGDFSTAVAAADSALGRGLTTSGELAETVTGMARRKGVQRARVLSGFADGAAESPGESVSRVLMQRFGLPTPTLQQGFPLGDGRTAIVDFWWERQGLVGEYDGLFKYGRVNPAGRPPEDVLADEKEREDALRDLGLNVVRWTTHHLRAPETLYAKLIAALERSRSLSRR